MPNWFSFALEPKVFGAADIRTLTGAEKIEKGQALVPSAIEGICCFCAVSEATLTAIAWEQEARAIHALATRNGRESLSLMLLSIAKSCVGGCAAGRICFR